MKTSLKLTLAFIAVFLSMLSFSSRKDFHLRIQKNYVWDDLIKLQQKAEQKGYQLKFVKAQFENNELHNLEISINADGCNSEFKVDKPFDHLDLNFNSKSPCNIQIQVSQI